MALTDGDGMNTTMLVGPTGVAPYANNGGFGGGFGNDWGWIILLLLFAGGGWGNGFGGGYGGFGNMYEFPWLFNGQQGINNNVSDGFRSAQLSDQVTSVRDGIAGLATQLCGCCGDVQMSLANGFAGVNTNLCNGFNGVTNAVTGAQNALAQQLYTNQLADLQRSFDAQTATTSGMNTIGMSLQNCCCENRANIADLKYTVATENCADRAAISDGIRDLLAATQAQTQTILTQMCNDKLEAKNDTIAQLRSELLYARGQASQDVQTAVIQSGQRALANEVEQYVAPKAVPAYMVQNPNCCAQNTCAYNCGCGMG